MRRKILPIGRSLAVPLPAGLTKALGLREGDTVDVSVDRRRGTIKIDPGIRYFEGGKVTPRARKLIEKILEERRDVFERLAKS